MWRASVGRRWHKRLDRQRRGRLAGRRPYVRFEEAQGWRGGAIQPAKRSQTSELRCQCRRQFRVHRRLAVSLLHPGPRVVGVLEAAEHRLA